MGKIKRKIGGLIYDSSPHYLDHLGPLCALLQIPLLICEPDLAESARRFYPDLETVYIPLPDLELPSIVLACESTPLLKANFPNDSFDVLWVPHGHSDKGRKSPFFEALKEEKGAFVYGQKIIDSMKEKNVFPNLIRIGNYRFEYFQRHHPFYEKTIPLPEGNSILYAPTWEDSENNSSFWNAFPLLAPRVPPCYDLWVKLHPNTAKRYEAEIEILKGRFANQKNLFFLPDIPPIYPLLSRCSAYLGDMSSIGYDFLTFDKPIYFFNRDPNLPLHQCGKAVDPAQFDFVLEERGSPLRSSLYEYTFDPSPDWEEVKGAIDAICRS